MSHINLMLKGYRLTTAEILYHMTDHPKLLQTFVWQELDLSPEFANAVAVDERPLALDDEMGIVAIDVPELSEGQP